MAPQAEEAPTTGSSSATNTYPSYPQPTSWIPLTTTFTPPSTCTENLLTILSSPGFFIWANEPVPVPMSSMSDCYPREFLESYLSVPSYMSNSTVIPASSVVPALSPLICPIGWKNVFMTGSYIACCPSGYNLHAPTPAPQLRPAYGGTCYSDFTLDQSTIATGYNNLSATGTVDFTASVTGAQAYAHVIDGWTVKAAMSSSNSTSSSSTSAAPAKSTSAAPTHSHHVSAGAIAGAVIGALVGSVLLIALVLLCLSRRNRARRSGYPETSEVAGESATGAGVAKKPFFSKRHTAQSVEMPVAEKVHELPAYTK